MITPRLDAIINLIDATVIADIGTDHAYIPIRLLQEGKIKSAIASDKNIGPINSAKKNVDKYGFSKKIDLRVGDGLETIKENEADTIIIAGMGGKLILDIIKKDIDKALLSTLVLQPMNAQYELRKFLVNNGFKIEKEELAIEGFKVYNILIAKKGKDLIKQNELSYHLPDELYSHKYFNFLKEKKIREFKKIANGKKNSNDIDKEQISYYENLLFEIEKI